MPTWLQIVITAVIIPGGGYSLKVLYGVGQVMGKIDEKLTSMNDRVLRLEDTVYASADQSKIVTRRRRTT
jgi:hypothetical protein